MDVTRTLLIFSDLYEVLLGPEGLPRVENAETPIVEAVYGLTGLYVSEREIREMGDLSDGSALVLACPPGVTNELADGWAWARFYPLADSVYFPTHGLPAYTAEAVHRVDDVLVTARMDVYISRVLAEDERAALNDPVTQAAVLDDELRPRRRL